MLLIFISFIYMGILSFLLGIGIRGVVKRIFCYHIEDEISLFFGGLAFATVYAGIFSLFYGVGLLANVGLWGFGIAGVWLERENLSPLIGKIKKMKKRKFFFLFVATLLFSYGASRGYLHFDTGLYHAQAIRWIEEYGVVPGLANLHCRLAYNSSAFGLTALYSFHFLGGQSLHTVSAFFALLLTVKSWDVVEIFWKKQVKISDFVKVSAILYISMIFTEMGSPASDYFAMILLFFILIRWLELEEKEEKEITPYGLLCVLLAVNVTIKLSVAIMLLLVLKPAVILLKEKRYLQIGIYLISGIVAVLPYLIRNIILSGWLVYPFSSIDLFSFDWKIPIGEVQYDSEEIKVYAKGMTDVLKKDTPLGEWFPSWFEALKTLEKVWILCSMASIIMVLIAMILMVIRKNKKSYPFLFLGMVLVAGYLFWQIGTPLVRYGYLYILAFPFFTAGLWFTMCLGNIRNHYLIFGVCLMILLADKGKNLLEDIIRYKDQDYYMKQQDYYTGETYSYQIEGVTFYVPLEQGQIGYEKFPGVPHERYDFGLRGESLKEGFRRK